MESDKVVHTGSFSPEDCAKKCIDNSGCKGFLVQNGADPSGAYHVIKPEECGLQDSQALESQAPEVHNNTSLQDCADLCLASNNQFKSFAYSSPTTSCMLFESVCPTTGGDQDTVLAERKDLKHLTECQDNSQLTKEECESASSELDLEYQKFREGAW